MSYGGYNYQSGYTQSSQQNFRVASIQSLLAPDVGAIEVRRGYEYAIPVFTNTGQQFQLKVNLPEHFPNVPPTVHVDRPLHHAWVDQRTLQVTGARDLYPPRWNQHLSLGRIIVDIRNSLFMAQVSTGTHPTPSLAPTPATNYGYANPTSSHPHRTTMPALPSEFPVLQSMSIKELQELHDSDVKFSEFFMQLPPVKEMQTKEESLKEDNLLLAQQTMTEEPGLSLLKDKLAEKHAMIAEKKSLYDIFLNRQHQLAEKFSPAALERQLEEAASAAKQEANDLAERFQKGEEKDVQDFCQKYKEAAKLAHMRRIKLTKLKQIHT